MNEEKVYTREDLEKELVNAILASSKIDDLIESIKADDEGRFFPNSGYVDKEKFGKIKDTPYGVIAYR